MNGQQRMTVWIVAIACATILAAAVSCGLYQCAVNRCAMEHGYQQQVLPGTTTPQWTKCPANPC